MLGTGFVSPYILLGLIWQIAISIHGALELSGIGRSGLVPITASSVYIALIAAVFSIALCRYLEIC